MTRLASGRLLTPELERRYLERMERGLDLRRAKVTIGGPGSASAQRGAKRSKASAKKTASA